ncbi:penicillin acylase family protein [Streptomyces sp. DSM 40750]|uniref:penicillin acylase family protein n=1 Tax=Streptomyces sp. DSM 40750 TaxID=2801030 RepID=UPI00214CB077|nr:penicillin acylase family protein [Streptomyces sp. DSM 40750]UUU19554.1 penicillin acylase family protein [Streptomyces sp. DSM 40750]UUU27102.1 penicillin acylase family protein [Streptomyces sp. DSM 40750]
MRTRLRQLVVSAVALFTASAVLPSATAADGDRASGQRPSHGGPSAVIRYTEYGIPHIVAKDYAGIGFGTGWAQAADQVCVLADGFVTLRGERSRWFGADGTTDGSLSGARSNLGSDLYFRGVRETRTVEKALAEPAPAGPSREARDMMRGWAAGYNAWLKQNEITDPACKGASWVEPVTELDVAARGLAIAAISGEGRLVEAITTAQPPTGTVTGSGSPAVRGSSAKAVAAAADDVWGTGDMGSNAVAFRGDTTANGRGLLLGNPHYPWQGGRRFWQAQQTIPGELNVSGGTLLGMPTISVGFNADVAWSHTVSTGIPANFHELTLDPADPTTYLVDGKPERMTKRTVTVAVKGGAPVTRTQWWTRYGPVVNAINAQTPLPWTSTTAYALNDPNAANLRFPDTSLGFGKARSTDDVLGSLAEHQGLPWVNTVAADRAGHTLFTQSQVLPRITDDLVEGCSTALGRTTYPVSGVAVLDGSRGDCALGRDEDAVQSGIFGPSRMPTHRNTPYVENSNDSAWLANADQPITGYERIFGPVGTQAGLRTRGAIEDVAAMAERGDLTVRDLQRQQLANRVPAGDLAAADVAQACAALPGGTATGSDNKTVDVSEACGVIEAWDRTMDTGSRGALLFDRFWRKLPSSPQLWKVPFSAADPVRTPHTFNPDVPGFARALADTVTELRAAGIPLDAKLGDHQFVVRGGERIPIPGGSGRLGVWNVIEPTWNPTSGGYGEVPFGSSHIQAVGWDGSRCPVARTLLTYSQSSNPNSPHHLDQTRLFSAEKWVTSRFCEKDILSSPKLKVVRVSE